MLFPPTLDLNSFASDWVLRKVEELKYCVSITCKGYEDQFKALLIAIKAGQPSLALLIDRGGSAYSSKGK